MAKEAENKTMGYTMEQYYQISKKEGLPRRCPILDNCCRAVETRYMVSARLADSGELFDDFIRRCNLFWDPETMIASIEQVSCHYMHDVFTDLENVCPEVMLFEEEHLPMHFKQSAFGSAIWYKESRHLEVNPKHYCECVEFSKYIFEVGRTPKISRKGLPASQITEKDLENYLVGNLSILEPGLKLVQQQMPIDTWKVDIFATDSSGRDVIIELKSKQLKRIEIDQLSGQVSRYYHKLESANNRPRVFIIIPRDQEGFLDNLYYSLKHWIEDGTLTIFQFDYLLYDKRFIFSKTAFKKM